MVTRPPLPQTLRKLRWLAPLVLAMIAGAAASPDQAEPTTPTEQFRALLKVFQTAATDYYPSTNDAARQSIVTRMEKATWQLLELAEKNPKEPFAIEALTQIVTQEYWLNNHTSHPGWGQESPQAKAIAQLLRDHLPSDQLVETCKRVNFGFRQECETFLRTVLARNPHRMVQGAACLRLAQFLAGRVEKLDLLEEQPALARRYEELFGKEYLETLRVRGRANFVEEAESFYERAIEEYADVTLPYNETVGDVARTDLFEIRHLAVGRAAQEIEGLDQEGRTFKLSDYRGKVVLLYGWSEF